MEESKNNYIIPRIYWYQTINKVYLTIQILGVKTPKIEVFFKKMTFIADIQKSKDKIKFDIDFYSDIYKDIMIQNNSRNMQLIISKKEYQFWPRLYRDKDVIPWISVDPINFRNEEDDDEIIKDIGNFKVENECEIDEKELYNLISSNTNLIQNSMNKKNENANKSIDTNPKNEKNDFLINKGEINDNIKKLISDD